MDKIDSLIALIANQHLGIETLEARNSDSLDFHDIGVAGLKRALHAAFVIGREAGMSESEKLIDEILHADSSAGNFMMPADDVDVTAMFLMEGLHIAGYSKCIEVWQRGGGELVSELAVYAPEIVAECNAGAEKINAREYGFPGVFEYEVSSIFGHWFGDHLIETKDVPPKELAMSKIKMLVDDFLRRRMISLRRSRACEAIK